VTFAYENVGSSNRSFEVNRALGWRIRKEKHLGSSNLSVYLDRFEINQYYEALSMESFSVNDCDSTAFCMEELEQP
jgi:hypothetical protein